MENEKTSKSAIQTRIEMLEKELQDLKHRLEAPEQVEPVPPLKGLWADIEITDEELEEVTHPQRVIDRLKAENEALRREVQKYRDSQLPAPRTRGQT